MPISLRSLAVESTGAETTTLIGLIPLFVLLRFLLVPSGHDRQLDHDPRPLADFALDSGLAPSNLARSRMPANPN